MKGDLPPSSSETSAKFSAELRTTCRAATGPPVKEILRDQRVRGQRLPAGLAVAGDDVDHAVGDARLRDQAPNSSIGAEACSDAFSTTALPAASAGPIFTAERNSWLFHGTTAATTPSGSRR